MTFSTRSGLGELDGCHAANHVCFRVVPKSLNQSEGTKIRNMRCLGSQDSPGIASEAENIEPGFWGDG
ncbi:uncharacterized protein PgNI_11574 [Pyricularia grisea]|uniref:Uncharacterized protein n=1 Tax=Pyricularia grisea TaxID=148305 RepID=A0A6P8ANT1_PYRGI|nr:uncharacterized protein PgNI_11574 [Pyricularia grisea]TLD03694.1 hypothetical protein PgNI_11574 [Pyricularia grisea]